MACDWLNQLKEKARREEEARREAELARLEQDLAAGMAQILVRPDGTVSLMGVLPNGMQEACTLAGLQRRNSMAFTNACTMAGVYGVDFVSLHGHKH